MIVFHGSYTEIDTIDLSKCLPLRDFGQGFYVTKFYEQAKIWAVRKGNTYNTKGVIIEYDFHEYAFESLNVLRFDDYSEEWLDFVVMNRQIGTKKPAHNYDIVEGPVADDNIAQRILDYLDGDVAKQDFLQELKFKHTPSHQIALCSVESLQMIEPTKRKKYKRMIDENITQSLVADYDFDEQKAIDVYFESNTYKQLIDISTKLHEKDWQEIYQMLKIELNLSFENL
jgi:hypothetical protein